MREILFKAKRKDNGDWVEGYYWTNLIGNHFIRISQDKIGKFTIEDFEINLKTLCQYTGLTDKNGEKIWENDILKNVYIDGYFKCEWDDDSARYVLNGDGLTFDFDNYWHYETEVIGNSFDNTELLE